MSMFFCVSVMSRSARNHISRTTSLNFTEFSVHVTCGCSSVLVWQRCYMLAMYGLLPVLRMTSCFLTMSPLAQGQCK